MAPKQTARNPELIRGVRKLSRSQMYHKRGLWAIKQKSGGKFPVHGKKEVAAAVEEKQPKFYPADDVKKPLSNKRKPKPTKLRFLSFSCLMFLVIRLGFIDLCFLLQGDCFKS